MEYHLTLVDFHDHWQIKHEYEKKNTVNIIKLLIQQQYKFLIEGIIFIDMIYFNFIKKNLLLN